MTDFKCYLLDMDGTLYLGGKLLDGAKETVEKMREKGKVFFLTNNTSVSRNAYVSKLRYMGIGAALDDIYTAGSATVDWLKRHRPDAKVYLLGTQSLKEEFASAGIALTEKNPDLVVIGFDTSLTYEKLSRTCAFIRGGTAFIATHPDLNCPVQNGFIPDVGSFLKLIEASTGKTPFLVCGKPYAPIAEGVAAFAGADKNDVVMVGDRLMTDMRFALDNGFHSVLVLSGEATKEQLQESGLKVDRVIESIKDFFN